MGKIHGFTLAETLITLGIIGVVAALTLPILIQNVQQKILISRWKKVYAELNQAFELAKTQDNLEIYYNCTATYCFQNVSTLIIQKYIDKPQQISAGTTAKEADYKTILGDKFTYFPTFHYGYSVKNMTIYTWSFEPASCTIYVDINGYKNKPNILGKDLFALIIKNDKMSPFGQYSVGDFCHGIGQHIGAGIQNITYDENKRPIGIPNSNYAGLGCSYDYLYK